MKNRARPERTTDMTMLQRRSALLRVPIYALLLAGAVFMLLPLYWMALSSLKDNQRVFTYPPQLLPVNPDWSNYPAALNAVPFATFFKNTATIEVFVIAGTLLSCSMAAYSFARLRWPGRDVVFVILLSVLMLPSAATLVPSFILWHYLHG